MLSISSGRAPANGSCWMCSHESSERMHGMQHMDAGITTQAITHGSKYRIHLSTRMATAS